MLRVVIFTQEAEEMSENSFIMLRQGESAESLLEGRLI